MWLEPRSRWWYTHTWVCPNRTSVEWGLGMKDRKSIQYRKMTHRDASKHKTQIQWKWQPATAPTTEGHGVFIAKCALTAVHWWPFCSGIEPPNQLRQAHRLFGSYLWALKNSLEQREGVCSHNNLPITYVKQPIRGPCSHLRGCVASWAIQKHAATSMQPPAFLRICPMSHQRQKLLDFETISALWCWIRT